MCPVDPAAPLALHRLVKVSADALAYRTSYRPVLITAHAMRAFAADAQRFIPQHLGGLVALRSFIEALRARAIFKADLVVAVRVGRAVASPNRFSGIRRKRIRWRVVCVGGAAEDDGLIGVAFKEADQHLLPDTR